MNQGVLQMQRREGKRRWREIERAGARAGPRSIRHGRPRPGGAPSLLKSPAAVREERAACSVPILSSYPPLPSPPLRRLPDRRIRQGPRRRCSLLLGRCPRCASARSRRRWCKHTNTTILVAGPTLEA
ncbi:uncharacterized protein LOC119344466 [Triticum dicoccoides]|uniref:uncharacterized protein LOC119344466 n=1 Tax=Triticum dicoccoides TaxID=85692 RepID=UPI001890810A|nr:uncharacterized protein LOC119344466 [Triticum dicoccoides]